jgi:GNAT superfamily N-acetyltransferase
MEGVSVSIRRSVVITYLEMTSPSDLAPARAAGVAAQRVELPCPELNRFFYTAVGGPWYWIDLLPWDYATWERLVTNPAFETWMGIVQGTPVGYFELVKLEDNSVEIVHFGLMPRFIGKGYGGDLLTQAAQRAWALAPAKVVLNTNVLDGEHALANYLARGFRVARRETITKTFPDEPPGQWQGWK